MTQRILQWAEDRNLIRGSTPHAQMLKLVEEYGELDEAIYEDNLEQVTDAIGDCLVVLTIMSAQLGIAFSLDKFAYTPYSSVRSEITSLGRLAKALIKDDVYMAMNCIYDLATALSYDAEYYSLTTQQCLDHAFEQIKDRKGQMIDGVFHKDE